MDPLVRSYLSEFEMEARSVTSNTIALLRVRPSPPEEPRSELCSDESAKGDCRAIADSNEGDRIARAVKRIRGFDKTARRGDSGLEFRLKAVAEALRIRHALRLDPNHPEPVHLEQRLLERILLQENRLEPLPFRPPFATSLASP